MLEFYTVKQAAQELGINHSTFRLKIRAKEILPDGQLFDGRGMYFSFMRLGRAQNEGIETLLDLKGATKLVSRKELAELLGVHERTLIHRMQAGTLLPDGRLDNVPFWRLQTVKALKGNKK